MYLELTGPDNFDCSSFVCWSFRKSGVYPMYRTTAQGIFDSYCYKIDPKDAKAGDIIFFTGTYDCPDPISHVGIYIGGGKMIHAGDPIQISPIEILPPGRFYAFGRIKTK